MIVICVIVAAIGSFLCALFKVRIDEWLENSSMKKGKLSLNRKHNETLGGTCDDPVLISSDDDSIDIVPNMLKSTRECTNYHDVSDDLNNEDIIIDDDKSHTFNKSPSLFNWSTNDKHWNGIKTNFTINAHQNNFPESSVSHSKVIPVPKKRKLMNDWTSHSSHSNIELTSMNDSSSNTSCELEDDVDLVFKTKDDPLPQIGPQHDLTIAGIKVKFPVKPYPCQIAVVNSLIEGCTKEQNCLLESPTGSGKTLALLCGSLAWQEHYSEKLRQEKNDKMLDVETTSSCTDESVDSTSYNNFFLSNEFVNEESHDKTILNKDKAQKVPKVYYGTRTHKQIEQVIRELKKTAYRHKRMTILSSRDHTCIQQTNKNKNDLCNELLDPQKDKNCPYYNERSKIKATRFGSMPTPWDIEDLVSLGNHIGACPYFGARSLMAQAEIIFCPYNYILDPAIRDSLQIRLGGDIVILDEAHNIEDMCRDAANVILRDDEINTTIMDCRRLSAIYMKYHDHAVYDAIQKYLTDFVKFLQNVEVEQNKNDFREMASSKCWPGNEFQVLLDMHNVGCPRFPDFHNASTAAINDFVKNMKEEKRDKIKSAITRETKKILEHLCFAMRMIASDIFVNDYRMYVVETIEASKTVPKKGWISKNVQKNKIRTLKLICMNPAVIFAPLARDARSVILASGTLTPTTSFQSELGTQFPRIVNPNHIIPKDQVYIRRIPRAPNGSSFKAVYEEVNKWTFQDNLGNLVIQVCDAVPYGVLCFFSSYQTMNTICNRWKDNKMWDKLSTLKTIFMEPKDQRDLPQVMKEYRSEIEQSSSKSFRDSCGAIMFAVFRGKMAEGIDFSDNEARCVLAIGIPYLSKNNDITMKMNYNNANVSKGLLSGGEWYTVNAFRALNQAIGRCVRHINDWGAVLLIDERFMMPKYNDYLPKWIKQNMKSDNNDLEIDLQDFVAIQAARERGRKSVENQDFLLEDIKKVDTDFE